MSVKFLVSLLFIVINVALGVKFAREDENRPPYIPFDYQQVEQGDFNFYYEWWSRKEGDKYRRVLLTTEKGNLTSSRDDLQYYNEPIHNEIFPIHNEYRFIFVKNLQETSSTCNCELYDLLNLRPDIQAADFITANNQDTYPSPNKKAFMCNKWWIVNSTHALDVVGLYENSIGVDNYVATSKKLLQPISSLSYDWCFADSIKSKLDECFAKGQHCAIDYDHGSPQLVVSNEHIIQIHKGIQLIQHYLPTDDHFKQIPYYVLKYKGQYYYFPETLSTFNHTTQGKDLLARVSLLPRFQDNDGFLPRIDPHAQQGGIGGGVANQIIFINPKIYINNMEVKNVKNGTLIGKK